VTRDQKYDLTQGSIVGKLLMIATPIIGTQFLLFSYNLVDMFMLGRIGSDAVASAGAAGMYMWLANGLMYLGRMGAEIGVAQSFGRGEPEEAGKYSQNSLCLAGIIGLSYALICYFLAAPLIGFFRIREISVAADAVCYLATAAVGMPFAFITATAAGTFNGSGNSRVPFLINLAGLLCNVVLDPLFIFTFGMGVTGAAQATVVAQILAGTLSLAALARKKDRPFQRYPFNGKIEARRLLQILKWSLPVGLESNLFAFFSMILSRFVAGFGAPAIAVYRLGSQLEAMCWLACVGFASAITAFVGQNCGAGEWARIRSCFRIALLCTSLWGLLVTVVLFFFGSTLFGLFLPDPALVKMGGVFLRIMAVSQILSCFECTAAGSFRGLGKTLPPSIVTTVCNGLRVLLGYFLAHNAGWGAEGIWWGITLGAAARGIWITLWYVFEVHTNLLSIER
jgi:putative MATE family efflux protein